MAKSIAQLEKEGFTHAGLFGLDHRQTIRILRQLLKKHGLTLAVYGNYREYGDCSWIKIAKDAAPR